MHLHKNLLILEVMLVYLVIVVVGDDYIEIVGFAVGVGYDAEVNLMVVEKLGYFV